MLKGDMLQKVNEEFLLLAHSFVDLHSISVKHAKFVSCTLTSPVASGIVISK